MTDPASPAAVTEERIADIRKHVSEFPNAPYRSVAADLLAALDARGLELARLREERDAMRAEAESAEFDMKRWKATAAAEAGAYEHEKKMRLAAEARLAQANEALKELVTACETEFCGPITDDEPDDEAVMAGQDDKSSITFGMIRRARAALSPTPPAQSAGEALDPAGTGEGASGTHDRITSLVRYGINEGEAPEDIATAVLAITADAQASALADARRSALEEAAQWHNMRKRNTPDAFEMELHDVSAMAIRALTEPQHGNG